MSNLFFILFSSGIMITWLLLIAVLSMSGQSSTTSSSDISFEFLMFNFPIFIILLCFLARLTPTSKIIGVFFIIFVLLTNHFLLDNYRRYRFRANNWKTHGYTTINGKLYYNMKVVPGADPKTFQALTHPKNYSNYGKDRQFYSDKKKLYRFGEALENISPKDFTVQSDYHATNEDGVYYIFKGHFKKINSADPKSFKSLRDASCVFKSSDQFYVGTKEIAVPKGFKEIYSHYNELRGVGPGLVVKYKFNCRTHKESSVIEKEEFNFDGDPKTAKLWRFDLIKDKDHFYRPHPKDGYVRIAEPQTTNFSKVTNSLDSNADYRSYKYYQDEKNIYYFDYKKKTFIKVKEADKESFMLVSDSMRSEAAPIDAVDANNTYLKGQVYSPKKN